MAEIQNSTDSVRPPDDRLNSWKEIAVYLKRDVTTVQRWERREGMPVHRHVHDRMGSVYAFRAELDDWARSRSLRSASEKAPPSEPSDTADNLNLGPIQESPGSAAAPSRDGAVAGNERAARVQVPEAGGLCRKLSRSG